MTTEISWIIQDNGMIGQSLSDIQNPYYLLFTATARTHNQKIKDDNKS